MTKSGIRRKALVIFLTAFQSVTRLSVGGKNMWKEYRGYRWRVVRVPYGPSFDRRHPYRVEVEGISRQVHTLWPENADAQAHRLIDGLIGVDEG